jgi:F0F1-type ATP synthase beta subunit
VAQKEPGSCELANEGVVARVVGVVIDTEFPSGDLPSIHSALLVHQDDGRDLTVEVQEHLDTRTVRTIAMSGTAGLRRGLTGDRHRRTDLSSGWSPDARSDVQCARRTDRWG